MRVAFADGEEPLDECEREAHEHPRLPEMIRRFGGTVIAIDSPELLASVMRHPASQQGSRTWRDVLEQYMGNPSHDKL